MNILIVNAFGPSQKAKEEYQALCSLIECLFKKVSYKTGIDSFLYIHRDINNLDDYIHTLPSNQKVPFAKKNEIKNNFEKLDFVFIDGREQYLPWKQGFKLQALIELCKSTGKTLFAGGVACENLIYHLATNGTTRNIINSNGNYPSIEELNQINTEIIQSLHKEDAFLDYVTGDLYEYSKSTNEWNPIMNIGLHHLLYAEKFYERGKFVLKEYHKGKNNYLISSYKKEIKTKIQKQYVEHWIVKNVPTEFVVFTSLSWFEHNFCVNRRSLQFKTLCDSNFGGMLIEHNNSIGVHFHVSKRYPETVVILENFIRQRFNDVQNKSYFVSVVKKVEAIIDPEAEKLFRSVVKDKPRDTEGKEEVNYDQPNSKYSVVNQSRLYSKITRVKDEGNHCGLSFNNREMLFVENNAVIRRPISSKVRIESPIPIITQQDKKQSESSANIKFPENIDDDQLLEYYKKQSRAICKEIEDHQSNEDQYTNKISKQYVTGFPSRPSTAKTIRSKNRPSSSSNRVMSQRSSSHNNMIENIKNKNSTIDANTEVIAKAKENESVLTMLFPYIQEELFQIREYKPGNFRDPNKEIVKVNLETKIKSNFKEKYQKYDKDLNTYASKPSIRCSSAYIPAEEARKKELLESKKSWVGQTDFKRCFGQSTNQLKPIPNIMSGGEENNASAVTHLFRTIDKSKWVINRNFLC